MLQKSKQADISANLTSARYPPPRDHLVSNCLLCSSVIGRRCNFLRRYRELFFLLSPGETRSRLPYDHFHILSRERDYILLFSCFETRWRLQKIISHGPARKNEADSHENSRDREFSLSSALFYQEVKEQPLDFTIGWNNGEGTFSNNLGFWKWMISGRKWARTHFLHRVTQSNIFIAVQIYFL